MNACANRAKVPNCGNRSRLTGSGFSARQMAGGLPRCRSVLQGFFHFNLYTKRIKKKGEKYK